MNYEGIIIGLGAFLIIGILHPVVIKAEYYFTVKVWPLFLVGGLLCVFLSVKASGGMASSLLAVLGFSLLWSIKELFEQKKRVEKGWFPQNPDRKGCEKTE